MTGIADLVVAGKEFGIFEFYLPFVILFAMLYGLLQKSKIFGDKAKAINVIISLAASLFVMEYALSGILATFFATFFAGTLAILVTILGFLMVTYLLLAMFGEEGKLPNASKYVKFVVLVGAILAAATFVSSGGAAIFPGFVIGTVTEVPNLIFPNLNLSTQDVGIILLVALFVGIVIFLVRGEGGGGKGKRPTRYKSVPVYEGEE